MEIPDKNDLESIYLCSMAVALSDTMDELDYPCCISYFYSVNSPKQRTNRERQILSESVCFE